MRRVRKGITPIIASIILLLIAVALGGSSWMYIYGYWGTMTSQNIDTMGSYCSRGLATVNIKNIGTDPINISNTKLQTEEYLPIDKTSLLLHFNEGSGTTVYDSSGNGNNGVLIDRPVWAVGKFEKALNFTEYIPSGGYVKVVDNPTLNPLYKVSTEAWVKVEKLASGAVIKDHIIKKDCYNLYSISTSATMCFRIVTEENSYEVCNTGGLSLKEWHHVAGTFNGTNLSIYVDGVLKNSITFPEEPLRCAGGDLVMGRREGGEGNFTGLIDEVRILNRSLTPDEIKNQQGWNYVCSGSGNKYTCGDLTINKNTGGSFDPYFDKSVLGGYESTLMKDRNCNGNCEYRIITKSGRASKVQLFNC
jgi:flagellin-like protein